MENLIEAVARLNGVGLVLLSNGKEYMNSLRSIIKMKHTEQKVLFHTTVSIDCLCINVGVVGISMALIELVVKNHYYSLPNIFSESIMSLTPIIASDVPEMRQIID